MPVPPSILQDLKAPACETLSSDLHSVDNGSTLLADLCQDRAERVKSLDEGGALQSSASLLLTSRLDGRQGLFESPCVTSSSSPCG